MSYNIKFDDITSVQVESQKTMNAWGESMSSLNKAMNDFIKNQNLQGQAISSMRTYLVEVHGTLLQTLANLMNDYSTNLLLYKDGYYQIDSYLHTKLPGKEFTRLHSDLKGSRDKLKPEIELLKTTKSDISDLVSYEGTSHTSTIMNYNFLMNQIKNLDTSITQYESSHSSQDLVAFKELLAATKALIAEHSGKSRNVGTYQSGDFGKLKSVKRFALAYDQAANQMESRVERVKAAQERDKVRFEALARSDKGWGDMAISAISIIVGVTAIVVTWGTATPLVVATAITAGVGSTAYGVSNMYEAGQEIKLGSEGDIYTKAGNPIRDTAFMGNDKLYHDVGNVFVTTSAIMIPIGQTQSVVKGVTQFAIGEAGAYTTGQAAYHGTKFLGGSEEDAQTANFLGNLIGGYTASSVANKFSLNKVNNPQVKSTTPPIKNMPLEEYEMYRTKSVINPDSDTMTLGKYEPTIRPDGTPDWSTPGPNSYISKAGDTTYFSLGDDWNKLTEAYHLDSRGLQMFEAFNKPALDDAVAQGKTIRFSHDPRLKIYEKSALRWEWDYLKEQHGYKDIDFMGGYWYADK
ncbi:T7SS effector LXG polymorphic toxin [Streptococcus infantis]|uniref:T7SS effector LXG polymorphic toxin n=1 Tax=Streptococcus infantis TaxID=68892 RepID=UPI0039C2E897